MKVTEIFHGENLKAEDLKGKEVTLTIASWSLKEFEENGRTDKKICLTFEETDRTLICNKTNAFAISDMLGEDLGDWAGGRICIYPTKTEFAGRRVDCIRVKEARPAKGVTTPVEAKYPETDENTVPF